MFIRLYLQLRTDGINDMEEAAKENHCQKLKSYIKECSMSVISEVR